MNIFEKKKIMAEILEDIAKDLDDKIRYAKKEYRKVGKEQDFNYERGTANKILLWEDEEETIPKMIDKWDYVDLEPEEIPEHKQVEIQCYEDILKALEKLI